MIPMTPKTILALLMVGSVAYLASELVLDKYTSET
jgi:hypothetical protein